jgi:hypothetical protein
MISDAKLFQPNITIAALQKTLNAAINQSMLHDGESRKALLLSQLASLSKRFINERLAFEDLLSHNGMLEVSASVYCVEWAMLYYRQEEMRRAYTSRSYFQRLWDALCNH